MGIGSVFRIIGRIISLFLTNVWRLAFKFGFKGLFVGIAMILIIINSLGECVEERSPVPFVRDVGKKLINADASIYEMTVETVSHREYDTLKRIGCFFWIWINLVLIYVNYRLCFWVVKKFTDPLAPINQMFLAVLLLIIIQEFYSLYFNHSFIVPFRGVYTFLRNIPYFFGFILGYAKDFEYIPVTEWKLW